MVQKIKQTPDPFSYTSKGIQKTQEIKGDYLWFINNAQL